MKKLTKQQIIDWTLGRGWELDKYGHLQKKIGGKQHRLKLGSTSLRYEVKGSLFRNSIQQTQFRVTETQEWLLQGLTYHR